MGLYLLQLEGVYEIAFHIPILQPGFYSSLHHRRRQFSSPSRCTCAWVKDSINAHTFPHQVVLHKSLQILIYTLTNLTASLYRRFKPFFCVRKVFKRGPRIWLFFPQKIGRLNLSLLFADMGGLIWSVKATTAAAVHLETSSLDD